MSAKFIVSHLDEQIGPFEEGELKARWQKGDLLPIDYVFDDAKQDWILLSERFEWARGKSDPSQPPPLREISMVRKRRPPEAPDEALTPPTSPAPTIPIPAEPGAAAVIAPAAKVIPGGTVKMVDGIGEADLSLTQPGNVELRVQDANSNSLQNSLRIHVKAAEPESVEWDLPSTQTVGQDLEIHVKALDNSGHVCSHYEDQFVIREEGGKEYSLQLRTGEAHLKIQNTVASEWKLTLQYSGKRNLKLPKSCTLEWVPGPAARLIVDGPQEYVAGYPLKVQVKAVDAFGNLAKTYQGTVTLEIKAS